MHAVYGPILSVVRAAAYQDGLLTYAQVRQALGHDREPSPAESAIVAPARVTITDRGDTAESREEA